MGKNAIFVLVVLCTTVFVLADFNSCTESTTPGVVAERKKEKAAQEDFKGYPDFGVMMDNATFQDQFPGQNVFKLRQDYPSKMPSKKADFYNLPFDERDKFMDWIMAVRDYCFEGMIDVDFVAQENKIRDWYHMPFLHWGDLASEGFHGLAKEAPISSFQLHANQTKPGQTYALGFYNDFAGTVLHKMWKNQDAPDAYATQGPDGGFPEGTVIFKLLFTDLDETQVPYLNNPFLWNGWVTEVWQDSVSNPRVLKKMSLIQMDLMVRDKRADKYGTGWVFGTFCYNGDLNDGKPMKERVKNLVPVGIQFGNDPTYTENKITPYPAKATWINNDLNETFINPSPDLPAQHLGWGGRLDGPVDLNNASCMSCHATAEFPQVDALVPAAAFAGIRNKAGNLVELTETKDPSFVKYFQNLKCGTAYSPGKATSTDFSLQVSLALGYYWEWKDGNLGGFYADQFNRGIKPVRRNGQ